MELCKDGMFWCAFELVFGIGFAFIALILLAAGLGFFDSTDTRKGRK